MERTFVSAVAAAKGTQMHDLAAQLIKLKVKLPRTRKTINQYVNDAIGFNMIPEQVLVYSMNAFGTADAISFRYNPETERMLLRIHDLKTGTTKCKPEQLFVYAAFFCLEYGFKPAEIDIELRIYQNDTHEIYIPDPHEITRIMSKTIESDRRLTQLREEMLS